MVFPKLLDIQIDCVTVENVYHFLSLPKGFDPGIFGSESTERRELAALGHLGSSDTL